MGGSAMNNKAQQFNFKIAAILCPALSVGVFQVFLNKPMQATAGNSSVEFLPLPIVPQWSNPETEVVNDTIETASPLWFEETDLLEPELPFQPLSPRPTEMEPDPIFVLTAVLPSSKNPLAVIDGKPRSVGDSIVEGWTLSKIVGKERYVILKHTSGRRVRVQMSRN